MALSRKDYVAIAKAFVDTKNSFDDDGYSNIDRDLVENALHRLLFELCKYFSNDNPAFDADRFRDACEL